MKLPSTKCLLLDQSAEDEDMQISPDISTLKDKITVEYEEVSGSVEFSVESYYPYPDKLGKQFAYADKKGIPFVIICGEGEKEQGIYKIKDMKTGEETIHKL